MDYARPQLIGQVRSARNTVNAVRIPDSGWGNVSNAVGNLVDSVGKASRVAMTMIDEKNNALLAQKALDFDSELTSRMDDIYTNDPGNAVEATQKLFEELRGKYSEGLGGKWLDNFKQNAQRKETAYLSKSRDTQRRYQQEKIDTAYTADYQNDLKLFQQTGDLDIINGAVGKFDNYMRTKDKYGFTPPENLKDFEDNIGDGYFDVPARTLDDGTVIPAKRYRISDDGGENTVSLKSIERMRQNLEYQKQQYDLGRQSIIDQFHSGFIDQLNKDNRVYEAYEYFNTVQASDIPMSAGTAKYVQSALDKRMELKDIETAVNSDIATLTVPKYAPYNGSGRYLDADTDKLLNDYYNEVVATGDDKLIKEADRQIKQYRAICQNNFKKDLNSAREKLKQEGGYTPAGIDKAIDDFVIKGSNMSMVEENLLSELLKQKEVMVKQQQTLDTKVSKKVLENAERYLYDVDKVRMWVSYMKGQGYPIEIKGKVYDMSNKEYCQSAAAALGIPQSQWEKSNEFFGNHIGEDQKLLVASADVVTKSLNSLIKYKSTDGGKHFTPEATIAMAPEIVAKVAQYASEIGHLNVDQKKTKIEQFALEYLRNMVSTKDRPWWFDSNISFAEFLVEGVGEDGLPILDSDKRVVRSFETFCRNGVSLKTLEVLAELELRAKNTAQAKDTDLVTERPKMTKITVKDLRNYELESDGNGGYVAKSEMKRREEEQQKVENIQNARAEKAVREHLESKYAPKIKVSPYMEN